MVLFIKGKQIWQNMRGIFFVIAVFLLCCYIEASDVQPKVTTSKGSEKCKAISWTQDNDPRQRPTNWIQCTWRATSTPDNGEIRECCFYKLHSNTALRVSYRGTIRIYSDGACNRWYFKFNGNECSDPKPIESILYYNWDDEIPEILRHLSVEGYCESLPRGSVSVELWVGKCSGQPLGDSYTGWKAMSLIMIEEVPPSQ